MSHTSLRKIWANHVVGKILCPQIEEILSKFECHLQINILKVAVYLLNCYFKQKAFWPATLPCTLMVRTPASGPDGEQLWQIFALSHVILDHVLPVLDVNCVILCKLFV